MRNEVWRQQLGLDFSIHLTHLDPGLGHRPLLERMSQHGLESSLLGPLSNVLPESCRFQDETHILEPVECRIELFIHRQAILVRKDSSRLIYYTRLTEPFCTSGPTYSMASCTIAVLINHDIGGGPLQHNIHKDGKAISGTRKRAEVRSSCPMS
jgi:hypothetical protein